MLIELSVILLVIFILASVPAIFILKLVKGKHVILKKAALIVLSVLIATTVTGYFSWKIIKSRNFQFFSPTITSVETSEKVIALTFDDGPSEKYTEEVLKILDKQEVKATFFLVGKSIEENFDLAEKIVEEGHQIGNHTYSHRRMLLVDYKDVSDEIEKTDELIRKAGQKGEIYIRSPYCSKFLVFPYYLMKNERKNIIWSVEPESDDEINADPQKIIQHVIDNAKPGGIILLHVMNAPNENSREALPGIIQSLKDEGYKFVTLSELMDL